ncbi:MAG: Lrp/AsnC family transcriptional regulator [Bacilli bacterium]
MDAKKVELLEIIEHNARIELETLASMLDLSVNETGKLLDELRNDRVILSHATIIDWSKVKEKVQVTAMIDVKVTPKRGVGFDEIAERIYKYPEVKSVYLMSGAYDLSVVVEAETMHAIAMFVSEKLSTLDSVLSTTTHFILKIYKHDGTLYGAKPKDRRIVVTP